MPAEPNLASFRGVWKRTELFEPRDTLGPEEDREKIVIWVQSSSGVFIDIRVSPRQEDNENLLNLKSFAGTGEYDCSKKHFTWTRLMDFRPPGAPDVGLIHFASPGVIEEDGVLPGDDFKEIWTQQLDNAQLSSSDDFVAEVQTVCGMRKGYFVVVGDYFAFSLSQFDNVAEDRLKSYFDGNCELIEEEKRCLMTYKCIMGRTTDWNVLYSLDNTCFGNCILPGESSLSNLLAHLSWKVLEGTVPEVFSSVINGPRNDNSPKRKYKGMVVPFFFKNESADKFASMSTKVDDVIISSLPKGGTTWTNKIVTLMMLGKYDDEGNLRGDYLPYLGGVPHQIYPESVKPEPLSEKDKEEAAESEVSFDRFCFADLEDQSSPRFFSTHLFGPTLLPQNLVDPNGQGKLIIVLRNLKDTLASLHFFRGVAKDGWLGNENGPGSLARFIDANCPNAYGSVFDWIIQNNVVYNQLRDTGRILLIYFEDLKMDLSTELGKIHQFLGLGPLTSPKCEAIMKDVSFQGMKGDSSAMNMLLRKGEIGDWKNYLNAEAWAKVDDVFEDKLGSVTIAAPLRPFHTA